MKEWYTAAELAELALPDLPATKRGIQAVISRGGWRDRKDLMGRPLARRRKGRGGGWEYHYSLLPDRAVTKLVAASNVSSAAAEPAVDDKTARSEPWDWFARLPERRKAKARERLAMLDAIEALKRGGLRLNEAVHTVARQNGVGASTVHAWRSQVAGLDRKDWLPALAPRHVGRVTEKPCDPMAWAFLKSDYMRNARPSFETCYRRLELAAAEHGWTIPSARTLYRRLQREIPKPVMVLTRQGDDALKRMYPPQERDRSMFHALEAVNADGHKWDVFVRWPDGTIGRPVMVAIQDLYSNKILAWRVDRTENADTVRLAFGDVFRDYGVPDLAWLDNGRGFAAKWITGGTPNRYRFKVKPEEPSGILTALGVEVHWTRPYSGQSKPIERAFRDFCDAIAKHPAFEGAYTGNKPDAKPENYGSRAVPVDEFLRVVEQGIRAHNARPNRNTRVCQRQLSFDQAFERSYADAAIRKAGDEHLRMCLLAAESVRANNQSGAVRLMGNQYWAECLLDHIGQALTVRFDPDNLHAGVHVYRLDGAYVGFAECLETAGFADTAAARDRARKIKAFTRAAKDAARLEVELEREDLVALLPDIDETDPPETRVVRMAGRAATAAAVMERPAPEADPDAMTDEEYHRAFSRGLRLVSDRRGDE